jgi:hypothetical protein
MKWDVGMVILMIAETLLVTIFIAAYRTSTDPYISIGGSFIIFNLLIAIFLIVNAAYCWYFLGLGRLKEGGS